MKAGVSYPGFDPRSQVGDIPTVPLNANQYTIPGRLSISKSGASVFQHAGPRGTHTLTIGGRCDVPISIPISTKTTHGPSRRGQPWSSNGQFRHAHPRARGLTGRVGQRHRRPVRPLRSLTANVGRRELSAHRPRPARGLTGTPLPSPRLPTTIHRHATSSWSPCRRGAANQRTPTQRTPFTALLK